MNDDSGVNAPHAKRLVFLYATLLEEARDARQLYLEASRRQREELSDDQLVMLALAVARLRWRDLARIHTEADAPNCQMPDDSDVPF